MTNGDRIRNMNNEELAQFLDKFDTLRDISPLYCSLGACVHKKDCMAGQECVEHGDEYILWWLNQEVAYEDS